MTQALPLMIRPPSLGSLEPPSALNKGLGTRSSSAVFTSGLDGGGGVRGFPVRVSSQNRGARDKPICGAAPLFTLVPFPNRRATFPRALNISHQQHYYGTLFDRGAASTAAEWTKMGAAPTHQVGILPAPTKQTGNNNKVGEYCSNDHEQNYLPKRVYTRLGKK